MGRPLANFYKEVLVREGYRPDYTVVSELQRRKVFTNKHRDLYSDFSYIDMMPSAQPVPSILLSRNATTQQAAPPMLPAQQATLPSGPTVTAYGNASPANTPTTTSAPPVSPPATTAPTPAATSGAPSGGGGGGGGTGLVGKAEDAVETVSAAAKKNPYLKYGLIGAGILVALFLYKKFA